MFLEGFGEEGYFRIRRSSLPVVPAVGIGVDGLEGVEPCLIAAVQVLASQPEQGIARPAAALATPKAFIP